LKYKNLSLKKQIIIAITLFVVFTIIIGMGYYAVVSKILQKKERIYMDNMISHVEQKISSNIESLKSYAELISNNKYTTLMLSEKEPSKILYYNELLTEMISNITLTNRNIVNVSVVDLDKNIFGFVNKNFSIIDALDLEYDAFHKNTNTSNFSGVLHNNYDNRYYYAYFMPIFDNRLGAKIINKIGTCVILSSISDLNLIINNTTTTPNSIFMIIGSNNEVIVSNNPNYEENQLVAENISSLFIEANEGRTTKNILGKTSMIQYKTIEQANWKIVSIVPIQELNSDLNQLLIHGLIFISLIIIAFSGLGVQFMISITNPISKMVEFINKGPYHNLYNRLNINEQNEIGILAVHINYMLDKIQLMTDKNIEAQSNMYRMELAKQKAELSALQSQINPHFLYNTLDCIKGFGHLLKSQEIIEITTALSSIMRYSIKGPDMVEVSKEISCIENYLKIISIRFSDRFTFLMDIDKEILDLKIPRFILQPIVENAIHHGLENKLTGGILSIKGYKEDSYIIFIIKDNGKGITPDDLTLLKKKLKETRHNNIINIQGERSIGLLNINSRLKFIYGKNHGLQIDSTEMKGTTVTIKIPL